MRKTSRPRTDTSHLTRSRKAWEWRDACQQDKKHKGREGLLNGVLEFVKADLLKASPGQLTEWGDRLRTIYGGEYTHPLASMPADRVRHIQAEIRSGLKRVFTDDRKGAYFGDEWILPGSPRRCLIRHSQQVRPGVKRDEVGPPATRFVIQLEWDSDEEGAIIAGLAELVCEVGARLRACLLCGAFFLRVKGQVFCSMVCGQEKRNRAKRYAAHHKGTSVAGTVAGNR